MHKKGISLVAGSAVGVLAVGVTLCAGGASAVEQTSSATATVNVAVGACTFERTAGSGTYTGTLANGAAPIPVPGSTFKTLCNDGGGYAVYAVGYSNDELGNTDLISNLGTSDNIHTGAYPTTTSSTPSFWAMKLENNSDDYAPAVINNTTGSDFTTFHAVPNNYTMVASYNGSTLDPSSGSNTGSTIKATYQAYASYTQPAGTYTGQVKYTMVHPNSAEAPSQFDDVFASNNKTQLNGYYKMQDMTSDICSAVAIDQKTQLIDARDNEVYSIAKLKDNKCWMTKNLNIAGGTALDVDNTDVDASYIANFTTSNNLTKTGNTIVLPASNTSGFNSDNYSFVYNSQSETCGDNSPCYSYYSWDAATLGSGRSISTDNTDAPYSICPKGWKLPSTYNGSGTAAEATDFRALMIALGGSNSVQTYGNNTTPKGSELHALFGPGTVPNFLLAGYYDFGSFDNGGSVGVYWSSTSRSNSNGARDLYFGSSTVYSADYYGRRLGFSVRCLAE